MSTTPYAGPVPQHTVAIQQVQRVLDCAQKAFLPFAFGLASWLVARRIPLVDVDYTESPVLPGGETGASIKRPSATASRTSA